MSAKKFIVAAAFAAVALFSGINAYNNSNEVQLSDLALANVEALASGETTPGVVMGSCLNPDGNMYCLYSCPGCPRVWSSQSNGTVLESISGTCTCGTKVSL